MITGRGEEEKESIERGVTRCVNRGVVTNS